MPRHNRMFNTRCTLATNSVESIDLQILHLERRKCIARASRDAGDCGEQVAQLIDRWGEEAVEAIREDLRILSTSKRAIFDCNYLYMSLCAMGYTESLIREAMRAVN